MSAKTKTCGGCTHFVRVKDWGEGRNGMCGKFDYNCHSDSRYARRCPSFQGKRFVRKKAEKA